MGVSYKDKHEVNCLCDTTLGIYIEDILTCQRWFLDDTL